MICVCYTEHRYSTDEIERATLRLNLCVRDVKEQLVHGRRPFVLYSGDMSNQSIKNQTQKEDVRSQRIDTWNTYSLEINLA